jgi:hypothetical protein
MYILFIKGRRRAEREAKHATTHMYVYLGIKLYVCNLKSHFK